MRIGCLPADGLLRASRVTCPGEPSSWVNPHCAPSTVFQRTRKLGPLHSVAVAVTSFKQRQSTEPICPRLGGGEGGTEEVGALGLHTWAAENKVRWWAFSATVLHSEGELGMQDGQWWRVSTRLGGGGVGRGGGASAITMAAHNAGRWAASVRGSACGARCARRSMRAGAGPHHGPKKRLGGRRGKGAGGKKGMPPFDLGEVSGDEVCRCGHIVPFSTQLGQTRVKIDSPQKRFG